MLLCMSVWHTMAQDVGTRQKPSRLDSIQHFLASYNKDKKYAFILTKQLGDNLLYADNAYDITEDVVAGLNKAYKGNIEGKK